MLQGFVHPDFSQVADLLRKQLPGRGPGGAAVCVYHQGECVVDIWGGTRNEDREEWTKDTLALCFSTTKGVASTLLHVLADRHLVDYNIPVVHYWPEFGQGGKSRITIREVLCHEAGLYGIRSMVEHADEMCDWEAMIRYIEQAKPVHIPGTANGYHGLTYGFLVGEIIRRVTGMSFSDALQEYLAKPLGLDGLYCGLPESEMDRVAQLIMPRGATGNQKRSGSWRRAMVKLALNGVLNITGSSLEHTRQGLLPRGISSFDFNSPQVVASCIPSANGMFTARSLARLYAMLANEGEIDGVRLLSKDRIRRMGEVQSTRRDKVVHLPMRWRMGYHRVFTTGPRTPNAFGHFGFGGSGAWCDPSRGLSLGMTLNSGVGTPFGDSRIAYINSAAIRAADRCSREGSPLVSAY
ncbi:MAG: serine hydrolase domain-containing protein [Ketobacteraceae bacterium]|nr:serine hydrolase domain-containing protein [Ketobacteraceae bacterium]